MCSSACTHSLALHCALNTPTNDPLEAEGAAAAVGGSFVQGEQEVESYAYSVPQKLQSIIKCRLTNVSQ